MLALVLAPRPSGGSSGYFIFTDRGDDRIERAILGGEALRGDGGYDLFGNEEDSVSYTHLTLPTKA